MAETAPEDLPGYEEWPTEKLAAHLRGEAEPGDDVIIDAVIHRLLRLKWQRDEWARLFMVKQDKLVDYLEKDRLMRESPTRTGTTP